MGESLTFTSLKMNCFFFTVALLVAIVHCGTEQRSGTISFEAGIGSYSKKQNDFVNPLEDANEKTAESNSTRQSSTEKRSKRIEEYDSKELGSASMQQGIHRTTRTQNNEEIGKE